MASLSFNFPRGGEENRLRETAPALKFFTTCVSPGVAKPRFPHTENADNDNVYLVRLLEA